MGLYKDKKSYLQNICDTGPLENLGLFWIIDHNEDARHNIFEMSYP